MAAWDAAQVASSIERLRHDVAMDPANLGLRLELAWLLIARSLFEAGRADFAGEYCPPDTTALLEARKRSRDAQRLAAHQMVMVEHLGVDLDHRRDAARLREFMNRIGAAAATEAAEAIVADSVSSLAFDVRYPAQVGD